MPTYDWRDTDVSEFKRYISQGYTLRGVTSYSATWGEVGKTYVQLQSPSAMGQENKYRIVGFAIKEGISPETFSQYRQDISQQQYIPQASDFPERRAGEEAYAEAMAQRQQKVAGLSESQKRYYQPSAPTTYQQAAPLTQQVTERPQAAVPERHFPGTVSYVTTKETYKPGLKPVGYVSSYTKEKSTPEIKIEQPTITMPSGTYIETKSSYLNKTAGEYQLKALRAESPLKKAYYTGVQTFAEVGGYVIPRVKSAAIIAAAPFVPTLASKEFGRTIEGIKYTAGQIKIKGTEYAYEKGGEFGTALYTKPASTLVIVGLEVAAAKGLGKVVSTAFPVKVKTTQTGRLLKETTVRTEPTVVVTETGATKPIKSITTGGFVEAVKIRAKSLFGTKEYGYLGSGESKVLSAEGKVNVGKIESKGTLFKGDQEIAAISSTGAFISKPSLIPKVRQFISRTLVGKKVSTERGVQFPMEQEGVAKVSFTGEPGAKPKMVSASVTKKYLEISSPEGITRQYVEKGGGITAKEFKKAYSTAVYKPKMAKLPAPEGLPKASAEASQQARVKTVLARPKTLFPSKNIALSKVKAIETAKVVKVGTLAKLGTSVSQKMVSLPKQVPVSRHAMTPSQANVPVASLRQSGVSRVDLFPKQGSTPGMMSATVPKTVPITTSSTVQIPIMRVPTGSGTPSGVPPRVPVTPPVVPFVWPSGFKMGGSYGKSKDARIKGRYTPSVAGAFFLKPISKAPKMRLTGLELRAPVKMKMPVRKKSKLFKINKILWWK